MRSRLVILTMAVGAITATHDAHAMMSAECQDIKYIESQATTIVDGEVIDVRSQKEENSVFTLITIQVDKYRRGEGPDSVIIKQFGGTYEENGEVFNISESETPTFMIGEKGTFYLEQPDTPYYAGQFYTTVCATGVMTVESPATPPDPN